jgi:predicted DNA-binding protein (UPF0251 family)
MSRPVKLRKIKELPIYDLFKPMGVPVFKLEQVALKVEELEAMRLKDIESLNQKECADRMQISRQTFQLIIDEARKKVTTALTTGKAIRIDGGHYTLKICTYTCQVCGHIYETAYEQIIQICPNCGSKNVRCNNSSHFCEENCYRSKNRQK